MIPRMRYNHSLSLRSSAVCSKMALGETRQAGLVRQGRSEEKIDKSAALGAECGDTDDKKGPGSASPAVSPAG